MSRARTLVLGLAATALAIGGVVAAQPASAANADATKVVNCMGNAVVKPKSIVIACADANIAVNDITWSSWTLNDAKGKGTLVWNTCLPETCADGIVEEYPVRITLGRVASGPSLSIFSGMRLTFTGNAPAGLTSGYYILDNEVR